MDAFTTIIGYQDIKQELLYILDQLVDPEKYAALGVGEPHGLLLYGEPGVGKSTFAQCFLQDSGRKTYVLRKDKPNGEFVKEITRIFEEAATNAPSVILLDDLDKFSNEDERHRDAEEFVTIQACIDRVRDQRVFVIATANELRKLPESLKRAGRFDHVLELRCPDGTDAEKIVAHFLKKKAYVADVEPRTVARLMQGYSCADLEAVVNQAGAYAAFDGKSKVQMAHMIKAILRILYKAPESTAMNPQKQKQVACHEVGHALVAELLEPGSVELVSVLCRRSNTAGITATYQDENYWLSKKLMENRVLCLLAGKAATEIYYGTVDVGVSSDMNRVFDIVKRFVDTYCSNGFEQYQHGREPSQELLARTENQVAMEVDRYYRQARQLLIENRTKLEVLIDRLVEEQTLLGEQLREILKCA